MSEQARITRCYAMRFERTTHHTPARLWRAITDPSHISSWMGHPATIDLRVGGCYEVDFSTTTHDDAGSLDGVIVRLEIERRLAYVWGLSVIEWTITPEGKGCRYTFLHHGQPPGLVPDEPGIAAGWHAWLDDLETFMRGERIEDAPERAEMLTQRYRRPIEQVLLGTDPYATDERSPR